LVFICPLLPEQVQKSPPRSHSQVAQHWKKSNNITNK